MLIYTIHTSILCNFRISRSLLVFSFCRLQLSHRSSLLQAFSKKSSKGKVKKSIFASPDTVDGKVGVGTCGHSGQPMTAYHQNEKWKKAANL